jgi:hypothetical protein
MQNPRPPPLLPLLTRHFISRFRHVFFSRLGLPSPSTYRLPLPLPPLILLYSKTHGHSGSVWPILCSLSPVIQRVVPGARVMCVDFTQVNALHIQVRVIPKTKLECL